MYKTLSLTVLILAVGLVAGCEKKKDEAETKKKSQNTEAAAADQAPMAEAMDPETKQPALEPTEPKRPQAVKMKKVDPATLTGKLAKIYQATKGINAGAGKWKKYHAAVIKRHGKPNVTIKLYGKPAYFWAAREGDVCVQFGYPQPKNIKAKTWTSWQPSIVTQPPEGLPFGEKMLAERNWKECVAYSEGKNPRKN